MSDEAARARGYEPLAYIRSYAVAAVDPGGSCCSARVGRAPGPGARRYRVEELGLIEIHEAFAAQVLSNLQGFAAKGWEIDEDIINVMGGSIALATLWRDRRRIVTTLANEMRRRDVQFGLVSVCAQAGCLRYGPGAPLMQPGKRGWRAR